MSSRSVLDADGIRAMQQAVETVQANADLVDYVVRIVEATRAHDSLEIGSSPRGGLALIKVARARAALAGRSFVTPDDVKALAVVTLAHRVVLRTDAWVRGVREADVIQACLDQVPTPTSLTAEDQLVGQAGRPNSTHPGA